MPNLESSSENGNDICEKKLCKLIVTNLLLVRLTDWITGAHSWPVTPRTCIHQGGDLQPGQVASGRSLSLWGRRLDLHRGSGAWASEESGNQGGMGWGTELNLMAWWH